MKSKPNRMLFFILFILCAIGVLFGLYFFVMGRTNPQLPGTHVSIGGKLFSAEVADRMVSRVRGLSGRDGLPEDAGMLFIFPTSSMTGFWMKDMKFAIDIVWIHGDTVAGFSEHMLPEPGKSLFSLKIYYPPEVVDKVFEINSGAVQRYGLKVGDRVRIQE